MVEKKRIDWWETIYLVLYGCIVAHDFLDTTMFPITWPPKFMLIFYSLLMVYSLAKFKRHNQYSKKEIVASGVILITFITAAVISDYSFLFEIGFLIVAAKDISIDKLLKVYVAIGTTIMVVAFIASQMEIIENLQYWKGENMRFSFGIIYPTDFAAHIFYLVLAATCIGNRIIRIRDVLITLFLAVFIYKEARASTSFLCVVSYAILILIIKYFLVSQKEAGVHKMKTNPLVRLMTYISIGLGAMFLLLTQMYSPERGITVSLDKAFSDRLSISAKGVSEYGYKLFGQNVEEAGWGRSIEEKVNYFFLDDSYIRIALEYGLIILVMVLVMWVMITQKALKQERVILVVALSMIAIHCFMEQHLLEVAYNPFVLCVFADMSWNRDKRNHYQLDQNVM